MFDDFKIKDIMLSETPVYDDDLDVWTRVGPHPAEVESLLVLRDTQWLGRLLMFLESREMYAPIYFTPADIGGALDMEVEDACDLFESFFQVAPTPDGYVAGEVYDVVAEAVRDAEAGGSG